MDTSNHVTAVITHRVRPGRETGYEEWIKSISADARSFDGHLGVQILRPHRGVSSEYVIILQFDTCQHLETWMQSKIRKGWIERVKPLIREQQSIQVLTGLEAWFQLPEQPTHSAPRRYKQAILVWIGVASISLLVSPHVTALLISWPWILRLFANVAITVFLLTYGVMPFLTRRFQDWLFKE
jgi:antibiotic biosynthesis monooxygenase (ABM) superfamily enzyme